MSIDLMQHVHLGRPVSALGLAFVPLFPVQPEVPFVDGVDAVARGDLLVREAESPNVPSVSVTNVAQQAVFLAEGCVLVGGLQDRVTTRPVWVEPGGVATVPVHCVEQGRWGPRAGGGGAFRAERAPLAFAERGFSSKREQVATWGVVEELRQARGRSAEGSLAEVREDAALDGLAGELVLPWSASGVVVFWGHPDGTSWPVVQWFACAEAFRGAWPSLRRVVLEAHLERCARRGIDVRSAVAPRLQLTQVAARVSKVGEATVEAVEWVGPRVEAQRLHRRGESTELWGWRLVREGALVQVGVVRR
jgi:hypothetical protein